MAQLLAASQLTVAHGSRTLFSGISLGVDPDTRLGLIGDNGTGKSTLLKILAGQLVPDSGQVVVNRGLNVVLVAQDLPDYGGLTVGQVLEEAGGDSGLGATRSMLGRAGFTEPDRLVRDLSGGWKKRVSLAAAFLRRPDLLLLDEPTNHLDIRSILWLEGMLRQLSCPFVLVTHDRFFLDRTCKTLGEISPAYAGGIFFAPIPYEAFYDTKTAFLEGQRNKADSLKNRLAREEEWLRRQPKARGTKAKYRIDQAGDMRRELQALQHSLQEKGTSVEFSGSGRRTKDLIVAQGVGKSFGERTICQSLSLVVGPGTRLGLLGENGSGKSTILKLLNAEISPDKGQVVHASALRIVHFDQYRQGLKDTDSIKDSLGANKDQVVFQGQVMHVSRWARRFGFEVRDLDRLTSTLSGGERARLIIASLMLQPADVLLLDEPTNDLDIATIEALEDSLEQFPGAVLVISHDRYFLTGLCDQYLALDGKGTTTFLASYEQWEAQMSVAEGTQSKGGGGGGSSSTTASDAGKIRGNERKGSSKRLSYMEQREYDSMESAILEAELNLSSLQTESENPSLVSDSQAMVRLSQELAIVQERLEKLYKRWAELEDKLGSGD